MRIRVKREPSSRSSTASYVYVDGVWFCFGMEDVVREVPGTEVWTWKIPGETAIPRGTYEVKITPSNRFKRDMIQFMSVPGFEGIRVHNGKGPESTEGCLLVSSSSEFNYDKTAMHELEALVKNALDRGEPVTVEVE